MDIHLYLNDVVNKVSPFEENRVKSTVVTNVTGNVCYLPCKKIKSCNFLAMVKRGIFLNNEVVFTEHKAGLFFDQKKCHFRHFNENECYTRAYSTSNIVLFLFVLASVCLGRQW